MISVHNALPRPDILLGILSAGPVRVDTTAPGFTALLGSLLEQRRNPLTDADEAVRTSVRDMLRNGRYKPTGRSKPASEYLLRSAGEPGGNGFPRINGPVDVCNYISLKYLIPVSLWDLDLAGTDQFRFRLGHPGETYVFNTGGQEIALQDLIVGCRIVGDGDEPIVTPVKDSLATKTTAQTTRVAACIYAPAGLFDRDRLSAVCAEFGELLGMTAEGGAAHGVAGCNETISI
jgi:DNA/RNA-binding domain of Phe-tRNA-synthetase-like protein